MMVYFLNIPSMAVHELKLRYSRWEVTLIMQPVQILHVVEVMNSIAGMELSTDLFAAV